MKTIFFIFTVLLNIQSFAGPGHGHSHGHRHSHGIKNISKEKALNIGKKHIKRLIKLGKLKPWWNEISHQGIAEKVPGKKEWKLTFMKDEVWQKVKSGMDIKKFKDPDKKQVLFIFLTFSGNFLAANFTEK